jgi:hypothetical protein
MDQSELASSDWFFFWDTVDRSNLTAHDINALLLQSPGTLYYNRRYGAGLANYENSPNALAALGAANTPPTQHAGHISGGSTKVKIG